MAINTLRMRAVQNCGRPPATGPRPLPSEPLLYMRRGRPLPASRRPATLPAPLAFRLGWGGAGSGERGEGKMGRWSLGLEIAWFKPSLGRLRRLCTDGLRQAFVLVSVVPRHRGAVPAAVSAFPVGGPRAGLCCAALEAAVLAEGLLVGTHATQHPVGPLVRMVHLLVVARVTRKSSAAARESQPAVALGVVFARALARQRLPGDDAEGFLLTASLLEPLPRVHLVAPLLGDPAPPLDRGAQEFRTLDGQIQLRVALRALRPLPVASAGATDAGVLVALVARALEVTSKELHRVTIHAKDVRDGWAA